MDHTRGQPPDHDRLPLLRVDWEGFCRHHVGQLLAAARRRCNDYGLAPVEAEDLVQEAVLDCMPRAIRGDSEDNVLRYVLGTIRNKAIDRARHSRHSRLVDWPDLHLDHLAAVRGSRGAPIDLDAAREAEAVGRARRQLAPHITRSRPTAALQVDALFALRAEGRSVADHAADQQASPAQVKKWAERGAYLVEGWVHALCGSRPPQDDWPPLRLRYWRRGHDAGRRHLASESRESPHAS